MRSVAAPLGADLRRISRDPMLLVLAFLPLALAAALRLASPEIAGGIGGRVAGAAAAEAATAILLLLTPLAFGFVTGFMVLDERDEGVLMAVALTPTGKARFLVERMLAPVLWSALAGVATVSLAGLAAVPPLRLAGLGVLAGLQAPLLALFLGAFAASKVEGMALAKVGNVVIALGALAVLLPGAWAWAGAPSPHFWAVRLLLERDGPAGRWAAEWLAALVVHLAALWLLARTFDRRTD